MTNNIKANKINALATNEINIQTLATGCFGLTVVYSKVPYSQYFKGRAHIFSDLKRENIPENEAFNAAVHKFESLILGQFLKGVDIQLPVYLEGIKVVFGDICKHIESDVSDDSKVKIQKTQRINAIVDQTIHYEIDRVDWELALEEHGSEEIALIELQNENSNESKVVQVFIESSVDEVNATFEIEVCEI
jgi:hypothetical protein